PKNGRCGCPGGPRRGSPYQAPDRERRPGDSPRRHTLATWTSQESTEAPRSFSSTDPWAQKPKVLAFTPLEGAAEPFRGWTVREVHGAADGACLQLSLGSRTCRGCGALFVHRGHSVPRTTRPVWPRRRFETPTPSPGWWPVWP
ncbi:unnamed protein product, partial [Ixodes persulcatus]